eukprot:8435822-Ditylum_brightwellii.AAC.1
MKFWNKVGIHLTLKNEEMNLAVASTVDIILVPNMEEYLKEKDEILFKRGKTEGGNEFNKKSEKRHRN